MAECLLWAKIFVSGPQQKKFYKRNLGSCIGWLRRQRGVECFWNHLNMKLGSEFLKYIDEYCPQDIRSNFSEPLYNMSNSSDQNLMRVIHYPPIKNNGKLKNVRAAAHTDINLITILVSGSQPGLQVKNKKDEWVDVKSEKGQLIVNIGDMLQECSNGYYPSTEHQVTNPKIKNNVSRFSIPLFMHPRDDVILSKKYTAASYLLERLKELGLK